MSTSAWWEIKPPYPSHSLKINNRIETVAAIKLNQTPPWHEQEILWYTSEIVNISSKWREKYTMYPWSLHANLFMGASAPLPWTCGGSTSECMPDRWFYLYGQTLIQVSPGRVAGNMFLTSWPWPLTYDIDFLGRPRYHPGLPLTQIWWP